MVLASLAGTSAWAGDRGKLIAVCLPSMDNPLMLGIGERMKRTFPDCNVQVASANSDANVQVAQIQNFTTMKASLLVVMPVEASSIEDSLIKARQAGIKVFVTGTKLDDRAYDAMATVNQFLVGAYCAYMTEVWVDKNYPNATPGSIPAAILTTSLNNDGVAKSNGLRSIAEPYLKNQDGKYVNAKNQVVSAANRLPNPAYCPQLKIVKVVDAEMFQAAQNAMQNILTTNPDVKVVLCCTSDGAGGVSQTYMDSGMSAAELRKIGVFGCGFIGPEADLLMSSAAGKGVFRGAISFGGGDLPGDMARIAKEVFDGSGYKKDQWDPIGLVQIKDGKVVKTAVNNTGVVTAVD
ncbi:MAG TPA: substrate-binding domain-containing protein [Rectinemataceae bacterium]|nr:substrate-binding domain-containing protein [Rectinemataceae bacterium]